MMTAEQLKFFDDLKQQLDQHHDETIAFIDHYLETLHTPHGIPLEWTADAIQWEEAEGPRGPYEVATYQDSIDFRLLTKDLDASSGKLARTGYFYWQFQRSAKIGRKPID